MILILSPNSISIVLILSPNSISIVLHLQLERRGKLGLPPGHTASTKFSIPVMREKQV